jgi:hypothetical protein
VVHDSPGFVRSRAAIVLVVDLPVLATVPLPCEVDPGLLPAGPAS